MTFARTAEHIRGRSVTPTLLEAGVVLTARIGLPAKGLLKAFLQEHGVSIVPFGESHWQEALEAYRKFGKGRHPAGLNLGDCMSYATARLAGQPLLFVGEDFPRTDVERA